MGEVKKNVGYDLQLNLDDITIAENLSSLLLNELNMRVKMCEEYLISLQSFIGITPKFEFTYGEFSDFLSRFGDFVDCFYCKLGLLSSECYNQLFDYVSCCNGLKMVLEYK